MKIVKFYRLGYFFNLKFAIYFIFIQLLNVLFILIYIYIFGLNRTPKILGDKLNKKKN